jgi:hypothetical protein
LSASKSDLLALAAKWRARARTFRREAAESGNIRDIHRLAGMASSLDFAARDLCDVAGIDPADGPPAANAEANRAQAETDIRLARDNEDPKR